MTGQAGTRSTPFESACPLKLDPRTVHILDWFLVLVVSKMCRYLLRIRDCNKTTDVRTDGQSHRYRSWSLVVFYNLALLPFSFRLPRHLFSFLVPSQSRFTSLPLASPHPLPIQSTFNVSYGKVEVYMRILGPVVWHFR